MLDRTDLISELKKAWEKTGDPQALGLLVDAFAELDESEELLQYLEHEWKRARNPLVERQLTRVYEVFGKNPEDEFLRLSDEVEPQAHRGHLGGTNLISELKKAWEKTADPQVLRVLMDAFSEVGGEGGEQLLRYLEHEWKRTRNPLVERQLEQVYGVFGKVPKDEFQRLKDEVEHQVHREIVEELSSEHGNLNDTPWQVKVLTDEVPYVHRGEQPRKPDYVTPDGLELWVRDSIYTLKGLTERAFTLDFAPEHMQSELERQYGSDAEFVTVLDGGDTEYLADAKTGDIYQLVRNDGLGERECPLMHWNPETGEDERDRAVTESDTWFGERPGKWCRLCEAEVGEPHGYLYLGEEAQEAVYVKLVKPPLPSTVDDSDTEREVEAAFRASGLVEQDDEISVFYEHGQWWAQVFFGDDTSDETDATYSVVDTQNGFGFERV